jgi:hypothetical protein
MIYFCGEKWGGAIGDIHEHVEMCRKRERINQMLRMDTI